MISGATVEKVRRTPWLVGAETQNKIILSGNTKITNESKAEGDNRLSLGRVTVKDSSQIINKSTFSASISNFENGKQNAYAEKWYAFDNVKNIFG